MSLSAQQPGETSGSPLDDVESAGPGPVEADGEAGGATDRRPETATGSSGRGLPGGRVVAVATLLVIGVAVIEVQLEERVGEWTGVTLVVLSVVAPLITRSGDRSLPAMMPPLAFLTAVLIAGQGLLPQSENSTLTRQAVMIMQTLGPNALWVIVATALAATIATVGHLVDRRSAKRRARATTTSP